LCSSALVNFQEYYKPAGNIWKTYPSAMILKVAESIALKKAFSINGLVTQEEMDAAPQHNSHTEPAKPMTVEVIDQANLISSEVLDKINELLDTFSNKKDLKQDILDEFKIPFLGMLKKDDVQIVLDYIRDNGE